MARLLRRLPFAFILGTLALSFAMRIVVGAEVALAEEKATAHGEAEASSTGGLDPLTCTDSTVASLLGDVLAREERLKAGEEALKAREERVTAAEARASESLKLMGDLESRLNARLGDLKSAAEDDLARLTSVYEAMKPKESIPLFSAMAPEFAAGFLGRMRPDAAAAILAGLDPEKGYAVSLLIAARNSAGAVGAKLAAPDAAAPTATPEAGSPATTPAEDPAQPATTGASE